MKPIRSTEEKLAIVIEGLKGIKTISEICNEHKISQAQYYKWRDRFLEGGKRALENGSSSEEKHLSIENEQLKEIIADQMLVINTLKKNLI